MSSPTPTRSSSAPSIAATHPLNAHDISFSYDGVEALREVDVHVRDDEVVGLIGPNGSGKTTLLRILAGHLPGADGWVHLNGRRIVRLRPSLIAQAGVGYLHQHPRLFTDLTVRENLRVVGRREPERKWQDELLDLTGLSAYANSYPSVLSHGQARLLQVARTFASRPVVALLDEPASGVNPRIRSVVSRLLARVAREGTAVLVVEHDMDFVRGSCQRVYVLDGGRVIAEGRPAQVLEEPTVLAAYFG